MKQFKINVILLTTALTFSCITGCSSKNKEGASNSLSLKEIQTERIQHSSKDDLYTPGTGLLIIWEATKEKKDRWQTSEREGLG